MGAPQEDGVEAAPKTETPATPEVATTTTTDAVPAQAEPATETKTETAPQ